MVGIYMSGKKQRIIFSDSQCARMREAFEANPYITKAERAKLAESLDISEDNVAVSRFIPPTVLLPRTMV